MDYVVPYKIPGLVFLLYKTPGLPRTQRESTGLGTPLPP